MDRPERPGPRWWWRVSGLGFFAALVWLPFGLVPAQAAPFAYIVGRSTSTHAPPAYSLKVYDAATLAEVATAWAGWAARPDVAVHPAGTFVYLAIRTSDPDVPSSWGSSLATLETVTHTVVATTPPRLGFLPHRVAVHPSGTSIYVIHRRLEDLRDTILDVFDAATNALVTTVPLAVTVGGLAVHPSGAFVFVTSVNDGAVLVIDTATNSVVSKMTLNPTASTAMEVLLSETTVHPSGRFVYIASADCTVGDDPPSASPPSGSLTLDTITSSPFRSGQSLSTTWRFIRQVAGSI
jgi:YVTN family beta-propeller protein